MREYINSILIHRYNLGRVEDIRSTEEAEPYFKHGTPHTVEDRIDNKGLIRLREETNIWTTSTIRKQKGPCR